MGAAAAWDAPTRAGVLAWAAKHRDQMAVLEGRVVTAEEQAGTWALRGDRDLAGFVGRVSRGGRGAGSAAVDQAATLQTLPAVADALADGPVTAAHVAQITRARSASVAHDGDRSGNTSVALDRGGPRSDSVALDPGERARSGAAGQCRAFAEQPPLWGPVEAPTAPLSRTG